MPQNEQVTSMQEQIEKIKNVIEGRDELPTYEKLYANLEDAADKMVALLTLEKCERSLAVADNIHRQCKALASTYFDEQASK